jgi:hypothetical protein
MKCCAAAERANGKGNAKHGSDAATGAGQRGMFGKELAQRMGLCRQREKSGDGRRQQLAAEGEFGFAMAVGQEAEVTDALKAWR